MSVATQEIPENKYKYGFIYKLEGNGKTYIGSSASKNKNVRFYNHQRDFRNYQKDNTCSYLSSFECLIDNKVRYTILEDWPCNNRRELVEREQYWMCQIPDNCNIRKSYRSQEEAKEYIHNYYLENKEKLLARQSDYYQANRESRNTKQKDYYQANKQSRIDYQKQYYKAKKEALTN